ncbi:MAG: hypothetical protein LLF76_13360 [Planctomycetaceae bacterium]|nr:hypothetical protein [Planctomycetaceae bacterium]
MSKPSAEGRKLNVSGAGENGLIALLAYLVLSGWLFWPYLHQFTRYDLAYALNPVAAAWGVYFLGRRWINSWAASALSGAAYGFGPFALGFSIYHPLAGVIYAMIPWLFLPSVYWGRASSPGTARLVLRALFSALPFAAVFFIFWSTAQPWAGPYFLMPKTSPMDINNFMELFFPLYKVGSKVIFSVYHVPLIMALMGIFVMASFQRVVILIPFAVGLALSFMDPILQVSPVVWEAFPLLLLSVLSGLGFQSMLYAGRADAKWIVGCAVISGVLAAFFGGLSLHPLTGRQFDLTAMLYAVTTAALMIVYYMAKTQKRFPWGKWIVLVGVSLLDLLLSCRYFIEAIF